MVFIFFFFFSSLKSVGFYLVTSFSLSLSRPSSPPGRGLDERPLPETNSSSRHQHGCCSPFQECSSLYVLLFVFLNFRFLFGSFVCLFFLFFFFSLLLNLEGFAYPFIPLFLSFGVSLSSHTLSFSPFFCLYLFFPLALSLFLYLSISP